MPVIWTPLTRFLTSNIDMYISPYSSLYIILSQFMYGMETQKIKYAHFLVTVWLFLSLSCLCGFTCMSIFVITPTHNVCILSLLCRVYLAYVRHGHQLGHKVKFSSCCWKHAHLMLATATSENNYCYCLPYSAIDKSEFNRDRLSGRYCLDKELVSFCYRL